MVKIDVAQIFKRSYDAVSQALKVKLVDTGFAIELDHKDGDSVHSVPLHKHLKGEGILDISECRVIMVHGGSAKMSPHPEDDVWFDVAEGTHIIAACRVKSEDAGTYIVARS